MYDERKQTYSCKCKQHWTGETCAELGKNNFEQWNEDGKVLSVKPKQRKTFVSETWKQTDQQKSEKRYKAKRSFLGENLNKKLTIMEKIRGIQNLCVYA